MDFIYKPIDIQSLSQSQIRNTIYPGPFEFNQSFQQLGLNIAKPPLLPGEKGDFSYTFQPFQVISWYPRIVYYPNFLSQSQASHIINIAKRKLRPSEVARRKGDKQLSNNNGTRTSKGAFIGRNEDREGVIAWVEDKIAAVTQIHASHGEHFNILQYEIGKHYSSHLDHFSKDVYNPSGSNRIATMLTYLQAPEEGGETVFLLEGKDGVARSQDIVDWARCDLGYLFKPKAGDALLFWSVDPHGDLDNHSIHGGCPVKKGEKWVMTKWIRDNCIQKDICL